MECAGGEKGEDAAGIGGMRHGQTEDLAAAHGVGGHAISPARSYGLDDGRLKRPSLVR